MQEQTLKERLIQLEVPKEAEKNYISLAGRGGAKPAAVSLLIYHYVVPSTSPVLADTRMTKISPSASQEFPVFWRYRAIRR